MFAPRRRSCRLSLPLLALSGIAVPALAAESYLDVIPGTALAWGAVNHIDSAAEKVQNLAKRMQIPAPNLLDTIKKESGLEKGIDEKGAFGFFAVATKAEKEPVAGAVFVAVADEKEFLNNFTIVKGDGKIKEFKIKSQTAGGGSATHCLAMLHGFAVMSPKSDRAAVEAAVNSKRSIAAEMSGYESWLAENDACVVDTAAGIKFAAKQIQDELKKSADAASSAPAETAELMKKLQSFYGNLMESAPNEVSLAIAGIRCDKQGAIRVIGRARLAPGGKVSKAVAALRPVNENLLGGVPGGPFVFAMAGIGIPGAMDAYVNLYGELMKSMKAMGGMNGDDMTKLMKESLETADHIRSMSFVWKQGKRSDPIYSNMYATMKVDDSAQILATQEKYVKRFNKFVKDAKQPAIKSMEAKRLQVAGKPALEMETTMDFSEVPGAEQSRAMFDMMFGVGNKMLVYNVAADEHTVVMGIGVPQERMAAALDVLAQPKKSLAEDADLSATVAMLPEKSQWVVFLSPRGVMQLGTRLTAAAMKGMPGGEGFALPAFPKSPPIGFAVKAASDELRAEIAVPAPLVEAAGGYVRDMQKVMMQRMMEQSQPPAP